MAQKRSQLPGLDGYDAENLQPWSVQVIASMTGLAVLAVALRISSRQLKGMRLWWDDYIIIFSLVRLRG